jgi:gamma-glutamyltranspeptidase / glutathione hydrolase
VAVAGGVGMGIYRYVNKDPTPIRVDPKIYDDYAGNYVFSNGFPVTIRREGDRLMTSIPEHCASELFAETETCFFLKGNPARWIFHRDNQGRVDYAISRFKQGEEKAEKRAALPPAHPEGTHAMIAATTAGKALEAGIAILKEGGSAADAAMATALCEVVHAGGSYVSFAGPLMMVYYDAASGRVHYLDAEYATPLLETGSVPRQGGRTALVPGFMAGVQAAHERFGKVPFKRLFDAAIAMADNGETVSPVMEWWINSKKTVLSRLPETKKIFTRPDGKFLVKGDLFRQPELALTLKQVAAQGAAYIYEGAWGRKFVEVIQREGGKLTLEDMRRYHAIWEEPLQTQFRDYTVYATGPTPWGGVNIIQALNLLELADLKHYGVYTESPESLFWLMQIAACQSSTRELPPETRISKKNAASIWQQMKEGTWRGLPKAMRKTAVASAHTDGLVVVDQWGNMAVVNHTINTVLWGNTGIFVDGISIPDSASFQPGDVTRAGPGNRLPNGMSPLIICRDGKPVIGSAAVGGGLHAKTLQVLANLIEFGMDPQMAVDAPAFIGWNPGQVEADTFDPKLLERLKKMGLKVEISSARQAGMSRGYWAGIRIDPVTGLMRGGVSRGLEGGVAAY